jgi:hypothetical protein
MIEQMMSGFLQSQQAQQAMQALAAKGFNPQQVQQIMTHVGPAASHAMAKQTAGHAQPAVGLFNIFGGHAGREFLMGAVTGLLSGDGIMGSLKDGGMSMIAGHMAEYLAPKLGIDAGTAGAITAVLTPFVGHYVHEHLGRHHGGLLGGLLG